eukprot:COSAG02_NODE_5994_length_3885_cov_2.425251_2_plen_72_part_00
MDRAAVLLGERCCAVGVEEARCAAAAGDTAEAEASKPTFGAHCFECYRGGGKWWRDAATAWCDSHAGAVIP